MNTIPTHIREKLLAWAFDLKEDGVLQPNHTGGTLPENQTGRWIADLSAATDLPPEFYELRGMAAAYVHSQTGGREYITEDYPWIRDFVSLIEEGGAIHEHVDDYAGPGYRHYRVNCLLQMPDAGGHSTREGAVHELKTGQIWGLWADGFVHGSTIVKGPNPRVNVSFGFYFKD